MSVFHVDPYASNFMYKIDNNSNNNNNKISIKIIDLDAAHCLNEFKYSKKIQLLLETRLGKPNVKFGIEHDLLYLSVFDMELVEEDTQLWKDLASNDKEIIDSAFTVLLNYRLNSKENHK